MILQYVPEALKNGLAGGVIRSPVVNILQRRQYFVFKPFHKK